MPVYEYECKACEKVFEVQQKMSEDPMSECPECNGVVTKIMSMNSFQLKGGGWYQDGYSSTSGEAKAKDKDKAKDKAKAPACGSSDKCGGCPAASN